MADPFAAMLGIGIDDEQKMQALADRLRGRQGAAEMFSLSTVPQISAGAVNEQNQVGNSLEQVGGLRKALAQRKATAEQNRLDREAREKEAMLKRQAAAAEAANPPRGTPARTMTPYVDPDGEVTYVKVEGGVPLNVNNGEVVNMEGLKPYSQLSETSKASSLVKMGERMKDYNRLATDIENLDEILAPYSEAGESFQNVPGFGRFEKMPVVGGVARLVSDMTEEEDTDAASNNYAAAKSVMNTIGRLRAGLTQTRTEMSRIREETGSDVLSSPKTFMEYYPRLKNVLEEDFKMVSRTTNPEVLDAYRGSLAEDDRDVTQHQFRRFDWGNESADIEIPGVTTQKPKESKYPPSWTPEDIAEYEAQKNG